MKKNKIDKDNSEKNKKNNLFKKTIWGNTVAIHCVLKKKTKFLTSSIVKK
jgi:hypothetical protein